MIFGVQHHEQKFTITQINLKIESQNLTLDTYSTLHPSAVGIRFVITPNDPLILREERRQTF
jgi:hypothetical protein